MLTNLPANMQNKASIELCPVAGMDFCWAWTGCINSRGYGCVRINGTTYLSHRVAYELLVGPIDAGLQIDHLCENKRCCNPNHLEAVTRKTNMERTAQARKTVCTNGHRYTPENTILRVRGDLVGRQCRTCQYSYGKAVSA